MDPTIYHIILAELEDLNCSLLDAFQDSVLENASWALLSADGKVKVVLFILRSNVMRLDIKTPVHQPLV